MVKPIAAIILPAIVIMACSAPMSKTIDQPSGDQSPPNSTEKDPVPGSTEEDFVPDKSNPDMYQREHDNILKHSYRPVELDISRVPGQTTENGDAVYLVNMDGEEFTMSIDSLYEAHWAENFHPSVPYHRFNLKSESEDGTTLYGGSCGALSRREGLAVIVCARMEVFGDPNNPNEYHLYTYSKLLNENTVEFSPLIGNSTIVINDAEFIVKGGLSRPGEITVNLESGSFTGKSEGYASRLLLDGSIDGTTVSGNATYVQDERENVTDAHTIEGSFEGILGTVDGQNEAETLGTFSGFDQENGAFFGAWYAVFND